MNALGIGVDIVEIARFEAAIQRQGRAFIERCFLPGEIAYCDRQARPSLCYAARFAAKEAVAKAVGTGIGEHLAFLDIEIVREAAGSPVIRFHGANSAETLRLRGIGDVLISISHSEHFAAASALARGTA